MTKLERKESLGEWLTFSPAGGWAMAGILASLAVTAIANPSPVSLTLSVFGSLGATSILLARIRHRLHPYCGNCGKRVRECRFACEEKTAGTEDAQGQTAADDGGGKEKGREDDKKPQPENGKRRTAKTGRKSRNRRGRDDADRKSRSRGLGPPSSRRQAQTNPRRTPGEPRPAGRASPRHAGDGKPHRIKPQRGLRTPGRRGRQRAGGRRNAEQE